MYQAPRSRGGVVSTLRLLVGGHTPPSRVLRMLRRMPRQRAKSAAHASGVQSEARGRMLG